MNIRETRIYDEIHTFTQKTKKMSHYLRVLLCVPIGALIIVSLGCGGCGGLKKVNQPKEKMHSDSEKDKQVEIAQAKELSDNKAEMSQDSLQAQWYKENPHLVPFRLQRNVFGKDVSFEMDPAHRGGDAWKTVWSEYVDKDYFMNRIIQLSPTVILYRRYPKELSKVFYFVDQAEKIEFLDDRRNSQKTIDIWANRPYQDVKHGRLTYHHFSSEGMEVIPYSKQDQGMKPTEYSLFTYVRSEGNYVIVNYELRSMETTKSFGIDETTSKIIGVKHTLHIYDLSGNLKYELKDLPSVDGAAVSNNGEYMLYTFGGLGLATTNNPFGTIEREGWALMRLKDQKLVYSEYTDDGKLAIQGGGASLDQDLLCVSYSTPNDKDGVYDYFVFFDDKTNSIYKKLWTHDEWSLLSKEWKTTQNKTWKYYLKKFQFQQISILEK